MKTCSGPKKKEEEPHKGWAHSSCFKDVVKVTKSWCWRQICLWNHAGGCAWVSGASCKINQKNVGACHREFWESDIRQFCASPKKRGRRGCTRKWNHNDICEAVKLVPLFKMGSIRDLVVAFGIPKLLLHALKCNKDNPVIVPCSYKCSKTMPHNSPQVALSFRYCISKSDPKLRLYDNFYKLVHVDKKWFSLQKMIWIIYNNKDHIIKLMFLCAACCCLPLFQPCM